MTASALESSEVSTEGWRVVGASVLGTSHVADAKPCQDAHQMRVLSGGCLVAAVSDGAGTAEKSEIGSCLAVETFISSISQRLDAGLPDNDEAWSALMRSGFEAAADALAQTASDMAVPIRQLSATLLAAIVHPTRSLVGSVGDCSAVYQAASGLWLLPVKPVRGEYANETTFLTSPGWKEALQIELLDAAPYRLAMFSDGLMRLALNLAVPAPHAPFFDSVFAFITGRPSLTESRESLQEFLNSERVNARTDDDKTLLLAWRVPD